MWLMIIIKSCYNVSYSECQCTSLLKYFIFIIFSSYYFVLCTIKNTMSNMFSFNISPFFFPLNLFVVTQEKSEEEMGEYSMTLKERLVKTEFTLWYYKIQKMHVNVVLFKLNSKLFKNIFDTQFYLSS